MALDKAVKILVTGDTSSINRALVSTGAALNKLKGSAKLPGWSAGGILRKFIGPAIVIGTIYKGIRAASELNDAISDYRRETNMSANDAEAFKQRILDTGIRTGVTTDKLLALSRSALEVTKSTDFVNENLGTMTQFLQGTGASADQVGAFFGLLQRDMGITGKEAATFADKWFSMTQAVGSKVSAKNLMPDMKALTASVKAYYGGPNVKGLEEASALAMVGGSPEVITRMVRRLMTPATKKILKSMGISFVDEKGNKRGIMAILQDINKIENKGMRESILAQLFGAKTVEGIKNVSLELEKAGKLLSTGPGGLARAAGIEQLTMRSAMGTLSSVFTLFADKAFAPGIAAFAEGIRKLTPEDLQALAEGFADIGTALAELIKAVIQGVKNLQVAAEEAGAMGPNIERIKMMEARGIITKKEAKQIRAEATPSAKIIGEEIGRQLAHPLTSPFTAKNPELYMQKKLTELLDSVETARYVEQRKNLGLPVDPMASLKNMGFNVNTSVIVDSTKIPVKQKVTRIEYGTGNQMDFEKEYQETMKW